jgi:hypothetical protein
MRLRRCVVAGLSAVGLLTGCGGSDETETRPRAERSSELQEQLRGATSSAASDFPATQGRTLQQVADSLDATGPQAALAGSVFTPGESERLAFGVIDPKTGFVYGPTAVYIASSADAKARGPFPAPADLLVTDAPYRSQQAATEKDPFAAIYQTRVPLRRPGKQLVLVVTKVNDQLVAAPTEIKVVRAERDSVVRVGDSAPKVETDTVASGGSIEAIDTRRPNDDMHGVSFRDVVGRKPVALLFATPQLCHSRVCGPVTDIALQLKAKYGDRVEFIHQEVYVDNDVNKGLRRPLREFGLHTEPWLFVVGRDGRVTARLEGSFGFDAFEAALKTAL